jgi:hypothetical protein
LGFNLRAKVTTLHENSRKRIARCKFGSVPLCFSIAEDATVGRLRERVVDWMKQRCQGEDWTIEGADNEVVDFEFEYPVTAIEREAPINIYLKQLAIEVMPSESWINLSDRLTRSLHLPARTLFRIYPVVGSVDNQDAEDNSYSISVDNIGLMSSMRRRKTRRGQRDRSGWLISVDA